LTGFNTLIFKTNKNQLPFALLLTLLTAGTLSGCGKESLHVNAHDGQGFDILFEDRTVSIRIGDRLDSVISKLGEPDYRDETSLNYWNMGLQFSAGFILNPQRAGKISNLSVCGTCDTDYAISGISDKGIELGDTRDDVRAAYGSPDESGTRDEYDAEGIWFTYSDNGRIHHIQVAWPR